METDKTTWTKILAKHPEGNFSQAPVWKRMNELIGHKVITRTFEDQYVVMMIIKDAKRGRYLEIPGGPLIDWWNFELVRTVFDEIVKVAKENKCVFVRFRPQVKADTTVMEDALQMIDARPATMHLHAENTIIIDLTKSEQELLDNMRRQTRYEIRRAAKLGITVEHSNTKEMFQEFHQVQTETSLRQHFVPPSEKELMAERRAFGKNAEIYVAKTPEGEPIAYGLILKYGNEVEYYEAASTSLNRKMPGAYALQWQIIKDIKAQGYTRYNLWGIAPPNQPGHRYAKVTTFKAGFGGEVVNFIPAQDIVIKKARYLVNYLVETIRKKKRHLS